VLQAQQRCGKSLTELLDGVTLFPQTLINVRLAPGQDWKTNTRLAEAQTQITRELGQSGRVLIRPSGTEPLLRVMVEASDAAVAQQCAERLAAVVREG
jgi:phosphoglucosamine mutase